jgi:hypothetical protein
MKIFFTIWGVLISTFLSGQFAIINDKDGFSNVRNSIKTGINIIDKLPNGHFVYCLETKGNWISIDYTKNNKEFSGQIYKDKLKLISDFPEIKISNNENNKAILSKDSMKIIVSVKKFERSKYKLSFFKENKDQLQYVNNKQYWGTDGEIPKTEYKSIEIYIGTKKILLPKIALENLFEINLDNTQVNYDKTNDILYIQSMNSDGAGNYEVIWKIARGIYKDRYVAYGF